MAEVRAHYDHNGYRDGSCTPVAVPLRWRLVEPGNYETTDGMMRVVRINDRGPEQWQAQERGSVTGWWSWISTRERKREAQADCEQRFA